MKLRYCKHRDLFGKCSNPKCDFRGECDGIGTDESEEDITRTGDDIHDGECCKYFEEFNKGQLV